MDNLQFAHDLLKAFGQLPQVEYQAIAREILPRISNELKDRHSWKENYKEQQSIEWMKMIDKIATEGIKVTNTIGNTEYEYSATKKTVKP